MGNDVYRAEQGPPPSPDEGKPFEKIVDKKLLDHIHKNLLSDLGFDQKKYNLFWKEGRIGIDFGSGRFLELEGDKHYTGKGLNIKFSPLVKDLISKQIELWNQSAERFKKASLEVGEETKTQVTHLSESISYQSA